MEEYYSNRSNKIVEIRSVRDLAAVYTDDTSSRGGSNWKSVTASGFTFSWNGPEGSDAPAYPFEATDGFLSIINTETGAFIGGAERFDRRSWRASPWLQPWG